MDAATLIRICRQRAGLTQRDLAHRAGTSAAALCLYERGSRIPRTDTLVRLVAATGATLRFQASVPGPRVDLAANGRDLEDLLDLADQLPQRSAPGLEAPPFASLAR